MSRKICNKKRKFNTKIVLKTWSDVKEILLNQCQLIKQESEENPNDLPELTEAMCKVVATLDELNF